MASEQAGGRAGGRCGMWSAASQPRAFRPGSAALKSPVEGERVCRVGVRRRCLSGRHTSFFKNLLAPSDSAPPPPVDVLPPRTSKGGRAARAGGAEAQEERGNVHSAVRRALMAL